MDTPDFLKPVVNALRQILWFLILAGVAWIVLGVLIILYPNLLQILFAIFFAFVGLVSLVAAIKVGRLLSGVKKIIKKF